MFPSLSGRPKLSAYVCRLPSRLLLAYGLAWPMPLANVGEVSTTSTLRHGSGRSAGVTEQRGVLGLGSFPAVLDDRKHMRVDEQPVSHGVAQAAPSHRVHQQRGAVCQATAGALR